jgi:hypothetical protein
MTEQTSFYLAMLIKPFAVFVILALLVYIRYAIIKYIPFGRLKRLLLIRLDKPWRRTPQRRTPAP